MSVAAATGAGGDEQERLRQRFVEVIYPKVKKLEPADMAHPTTGAAPLALAALGAGGAERDPLPPEALARHGLMGWAEALRTLHMPASAEEHRRARERVAFQVGGGSGCWGQRSCACPAGSQARQTHCGCLQHLVLQSLPGLDVPCHVCHAILLHPKPRQEMFLGQLAAMLERRRLTAAPPDGAPLPGQRPLAGQDAAGEGGAATRGWPAQVTRLQAMADARKALPYTLTDSQVRGPPSHAAS